MADLNELARLLFVLPEAQADLLRFLLPDFLREYDLAAARPLDTQFVITTDEAGTRTELRLDLLLLVPARTSGNFPALLHLEPQQGGWLEFQVRMGRYHRMIHGPFPDWLLVSIGITTTPTGGTVGRSPVQRQSVGDWVVEEFWFLHFPAGDLAAADHVTSDNALVQAHRANMRWPRRVRKVARLLEIFRALRRLTPPRAYRQRLMWWAEASLELTAAQRAEVRARWQAEIGEDEMERTFVSLFEEEALERGLEQGKAWGKQDTLLRQLRVKFGDLPSSVPGQVQGMVSLEQLDGLLERLLTANSLAELGLDGYREPATAA
jgi:hypothetical protein